MWVVLLREELAESGINLLLLGSFAATTYSDASCATPASHCVRIRLIAKKLSDNTRSSIL